MYQWAILFFAIAAGCAADAYVNASDMQYVKALVAAAFVLLSLGAAVGALLVALAQEGVA